MHFFGFCCHLLVLLKTILRDQEQNLKSGLERSRDQEQVSRPHLCYIVPREFPSDDGGSPFMPFAVVLQISYTP